MSKLRRVVLDVLKPHDPEILDFAQETSELEGVKGTNTTLVENEKDVENIKITVQGDGFSFEKVKETVENLGGSIHGIDQAICGERLVEEVSTPQD
ncbi:DUF211 domain-containing protein [Candidatus Nanohalococcus occultus]|uniref:DUF211 domain-containing protein n=1 Tax=Candidatus Nanohalococcus occultus TaxID=2978047 RepID=A0ABY8CEM0_9ARCH|nr:Uncharacterized protein SVXNc_0638 [Candidatus Nanohaloarchaeota archaeon SVXNc]